MKPLLITLALLAFLAACATAPRLDPVNPNNPTDPSVPTEGEDMRNRRITATQAKQLMAAHPDAIILDVREYEEFTQGHIPGATLMPVFEMNHQAPDIMPDLYTLILIYCRSGQRSHTAKNLLLSKGYVNVYDFGGINAWPYDIVR